MVTDKRTKSDGVARVMSDAHAAELRCFLRAMRARIDPRDAGLTPGRRRRATGLRIDEAAALANVSLTWYTAFEAGKDIRVSTALLERVATALRLNAEEREHLFALARPRERAATASDSVAALVPIIDGFTVGPAFICDRFWNLYATNSLADRVYGHDVTAEKNLLARLLFEPAFAALHDDWETIAQRMIGIMHLAFGRTPDDAVGQAVVARLRANSARFSAWWDGFGLYRYEPARATIVHPVLGRLNLLFTSVVASPATRYDEYLMIVLQSPLDDATRQRLSK